MSLRAITWVMESAPVKSPAEQVVLYALADRAHDDGTCAWPAQSWLAERSRLSTRTVRRHLAEMEGRGLIRRGDQRLVAHIPSQRRPIVWDLVMSRPDNGDRSSLTGQNVRPDTGDRSRPDTGDRSRPDTGVLQTVLKNHPVEPSSNPLSPPEGETAPAKPKRPTAHRLPDGWTPDPATVTALTEKCPHVDQTWELDKFRDYWSAAPDRTGRKLNWTATYRNWIRRAAERPAPRGVSRPAPKRSGWDWEDTTTGVIDAEVITQLEIE